MTLGFFELALKCLALNVRGQDLTPFLQSTLRIPYLWKYSEYELAGLVTLLLIIVLKYLDFL